MPILSSDNSGSASKNDQNEHLQPFQKHFFRLRSQFDTKKNHEFYGRSHTCQKVSGNPGSRRCARTMNNQLVCQLEVSLSRVPPQTCFMPRGKLRMIGCFERWFKASNPTWADKADIDRGWWEMMGGFWDLLTCFGFDPKRRCTKIQGHDSSSTETRWFHTVSYLTYCAWVFVFTFSSSKDDRTIFSPARSSYRGHMHMSMIVHAFMHLCIHTSMHLSFYPSRCLYE